MSKFGKKSSQPIGIFDSGVGGLSILAELKRALPKENFVYVADQKYLPYGEKSKRELIERGRKITNYFIKNHDIKMLVIACNTATCYTIDSLRKKYSLPILGTVPAIKPAAEKTRSKEVAIMSTPLTSKSDALKKLIRENAKGIHVLNMGCRDLVDLVDRGELANEKVNGLLREYLEEVKDSHVDYLVFGCTHYPFLKKNIQKIVGRGVRILEGGRAIAKHAASLLVKNHIKSTGRKPGKTLYLTTGNPENFSKVAGLLLKKSIRSKKVDI